MFSSQSFSSTAILAELLIKQPYKAINREASKSAIEKAKTIVNINDIGLFTSEISLLPKEGNCIPIEVFREYLNKRDYPVNWGIELSRAKECPNDLLIITILDTTQKECMNKDILNSFVGVDSKEIFINGELAFSSQENQQLSTLNCLKGKSNTLVIKLSN
ncbi:TPA: hypothetical protein ACWMEZ_002663 [Proteus mirabilis]